MAKSNSVTSDHIISDIKSKKVAPVYFLQGDEPFFIDEIASYIEAKLLSEADRGFNQTVMYGKDVDISMIITAAKRFPMMSERQVVIVKEAQEVKDLDKIVKHKVGGKEIEYNALEEYVKKPLTSTILILCYKYKTLDGRKSLAKTMEEHAIVYTSKALYDNELPAWITRQVKSKKHDITDTAVRMLCEYVGNNLSRIDNEMNKILVNFKELSTITDAHVQQYVGISKEYNVFELQNSLYRKDILKSNRIIQYFSENPKENPIQLVLGSLFSCFSKILIILASRPKDEFEASKILSLSPFVAKEYLLAARNYQDSKVISIFGYLREADMKSKGFENNSMIDSEILKELVFKILH